MPGKQVQSYKERLLNDARQVATSERPDVSFISFQGGHLKYNGEPIDAGTVDVVIVAAGYERAYYPGDYDPDNIVPPACFAQHLTDEDLLTPHASVPNPQAASCAACPKSKFGSATRGKGQACKIRRKLAVIPLDSAKSAETLQSAEIAVAAVPPTSTKAFSDYAHKVSSQAALPYYAVGTALSCEPHPKKQFVVKFGALAPLELDDEIFGALERVREVGGEVALQPYDMSEPGESAGTEGDGGKY